ncbi:Ribonuclease H2 subunit A [Taenia solium]|eukprot:TsM_000794900 transcript=TsM_000794900 gene=TsM_000794900
MPHRVDGTTKLRVTRDHLLARWPKEGRGLVPPGTPIGSGYPGDPATKQYLRICMDPILGFPPLVRSSWATAQTLLEERGVKVVWNESRATWNTSRSEHDGEMVES